MTAVREFLQLNHEIVLFVYGLVFFVLGLATALQSRHYSRLDLARSLSWLAAFGGFSVGVGLWTLVPIPTLDGWVIWRGLFGRAKPPESR